MSRVRRPSKLLEILHKGLSLEPGMEEDELCMHELLFGTEIMREAAVEIEHLTKEVNRWREEVQRYKQDYVSGKAAFHALANAMEMSNDC